MRCSDSKSNKFRLLSLPHMHVTTSGSQSKARNPPAGKISAFRNCAANYARMSSHAAWNSIFVHSAWSPMSCVAADCYISCSKLGTASSFSTASSSSSTPSLVNLTGGLLLSSGLQHLTSKQNNARKRRLCQTPTINSIKAISPSTD
ncbi:hypothetical protein J6590_097819 [Homalodisca vitripennis]|nr:hypothetical protein J6590_097819 [Homalodisca vitripennis]